MSDCILKFKERMKEVRLKNGLTQKQLAQVLNTSPSRISALENGRVNPNLRLVRNLCKYFQITANYLLGLED